MNKLRFSSSQRGMMLLEVLIAILIFAIGVLGMVKMQAVSSSNSVNSEDRATAALLADDVIADLWTVKNAQNVTQFVGSATSDYTPWTGRVTKALRGGVGTVVAGGANATTATITIKWSRQMGRNVDFAAASTDPNATAWYITTVVIQ